MLVSRRALSMSSGHQALLAQLKKKAKPDKKAWWENYVKGAKFLGVTMGDTRGVVKNQPNKSFPFALACFESPITEMKLSGVLLMAEHIPLRELDLDRIGSEILAADLAADWNICDWLCVKVLSRFLSEETSEEVAETLSGWSTASNLWQARASVVSFVYCAQNRDYHPLCIAASSTLIKRPERFAKTGVGWCLREVTANGGKQDVIKFIDEHLTHFTQETIKSIVKKFPASEQKAFVTKWSKQVKSETQKRGEDPAASASSATNLSRKKQKK